MSSSSLLSPPPSPHPAPLPFSSLSSSLSSSLNCCPELDLSVTLSPHPKTGHTHRKPRPLRNSQQNDPSQVKSCSQGQTGRQVNTQVCFEEPVVVPVTTKPHITVSRDAPPRQPVRAQCKSREHHHGPQTVGGAAAASSQDPSCLERVELNTTLALRAELQSVQKEEFNSQMAIEEILRKSKRTKNLINTRATEVVNVRRSQLQYNSLISVNVQEDQLISQNMQERLLLAPPPQCHGSKLADGPSPLLFMTSDLFRQKPLSSEEEPIDTKPCPITHPTHSTFDLYRRRRCYEISP